jgi:hypothetical protein
MSKRPEDSSDGWLELASVVVLSVAAFLSSWGAYQAALWDGEQAANYSRANALRIEASSAAAEANALSTIEADLFAHWLDAKARGDEVLSRFYQARFPAELKPALNAWLREKPLTNPSAPATPFAMPNYHRAKIDEAKALSAKADATFKAGQRDNVISDAFMQGATILALALFFGGIGQIFRSRTARIGLLTVASLAIVIACLRIFTLPTQALGITPLR